MTPEELQSALRRLLPATFDVFEPHDDGALEIGTPWEMPDGGLINVTVEAEDALFVVNEDGWHTSRWFLMHVGMDVPAEITAQVEAIAAESRVECSGLALSIHNLRLEQVPEAVERMALTIQQIADLPSAARRSDLEATAAAD